MAVSAYGDPSKLQVFPMGSDAAILFTSITGTLVEVRSSFRFVRDTHKHIVVLRLSTVETFGKTSPAPSIAGSLSSSSESFIRDHSESFHHDKRHDIRSGSKHTYNNFARFTCNI